MRTPGVDKGVVALSLGEGASYHIAPPVQPKMRDMLRPNGEGEDYWGGRVTRILDS
jgi:hypothetical protein